MKTLVVGVLSIVLVLFTVSVATADYTYLSPVNPGSVAYVSYYGPIGMTYSYPAYAYAPAVGCCAARPIVAAVPVAAQPVVAYYSPVAAQPVVAIPGAVVYPAPVVVRQKVFYPGQPVRNVIRAVVP